MASLTKVLRASKKYTDLGFSRHMPKGYIERVSQTIPRRVYDNRFGAPPITRWRVRPDDVEFGEKRFWEQEAVDSTKEKANEYQRAKLSSKHYERSLPQKRIPDDLWTMLKGDVVQVMVGKDKGKKGKINYIVKERNWVFVEGLHMKLILNKNSKKLGFPDIYYYEEQPLDVEKGQVMLVDPKDEQPCEAEWLLNEDQSDYIRVSKNSGFEIPIPSIAYHTYEYNEPKNYIEHKEKDTPMQAALEKTYTPTLLTFEEEITKDLALADEPSTMKPTYWY